MELTGIRRDVFLDRYARKDDQGKPVETSPEQMWDRVAAAIAEVEAPEQRAVWAARFREALQDFRFVPGGRILAGAGTGQKVTYYNCLPPDQRVLTPDGYVPIAEIDVRSYVITGQGRARLVTQVFAREADEPLYRLRVEGGGVLRLTGRHPVLARPGGGAAAWVEAAALRVGDLVGCLGGTPLAGDAWQVRRDEPYGMAWGGSAVLVRERRETYRGVVWRRVAEAEVLPYRGMVYDLEVEEDHSFVTAGVIVSNCYVIPSPEDSRRGIMESVALMVEIMSRGGGVGVNLSTLRPRGSYVRGVNGTASGPVSWGEVYSTATGAVIQGGSRRGALMLMLDDDHPDIEEFITVKRDLTRINNANLSVCVSDRFMEAVKNDADWELKWQGQVYRVVKARDLWNLICESAWASGEPGVVFMERCQKWSNTWYCEDIRCVNPCGEQPLGPWGVCLAGETRITTDRGLETVRRLWERQQRGEEIVIGTQLNGQGHHFVYRPARVIPTGTKPTIAVELENGQVLRLTRNHQVYASRDGKAFAWVEAGSLSPQHRVMIQHGSRTIEFRSEPEDTQRFQMLGWKTGDGWFSEEATNGPALGPADGEAWAAVVPARQSVTGRPRALPERRVAAQAVAAKRRLRAVGGKEAPGPEQRVPEVVWTAPADLQVAYLQGLFSADGHVVAGRSDDRDRMQVMLASSSRELLRDVQLLLLNLGMTSRIHGYPVKRRGRRRGRLVLSGASYERFATLIGFPLAPQKQAALKPLGDRVDRQPRAMQVKSVTPAGETEVFDLWEPVTHSLIAEGMVVHNCNLGAVNLSAFAQDGDVDWEGLGETVRTAVRFLDNVIDATEYYFEENERHQRFGIRRTGLGSMGLADLLIKLKLRYGSPAAIAFCERLYRFIRDEAYRASALIAAEKGPFPAFDRDKYLQGHFIRQLPQAIRDLIASHGIRNGVLLTQAPTGTTSLLAGVSSGIEPVFAFSFRRTDRTGTHVVYHELYQRWLEEHPDEPAPDYFVSADQLTPEEHVRMQAVIQKYVDASISKTVNAPNAHTVEEVKTLYTLAYDLGCKGVTYFREGCREAVLTRITSEPPQAAQAEAAEADAAALPLGRKVNGNWGRIRPIERPARLVGFTDRKQTPLGTLFLTLNTLDGHPVELFAQIGKAGSDVAAFTEGIARLVSVALRSGIDPLEIANQLKGIGGSRSVGFGAARVRSVPDAIGQFIEEVAQQARGQERPREGGPGGNGHGPVPAALAASREPGAAAVGAEAELERARLSFNLCPSCGLHALAFVEGCALCYACGYSEC